MKKKGQKNSIIKPLNPPTLKVEEKKKTYENPTDQFKGSVKQKSGQKKIINLNMFDKTKNRLKNTLKSTRYKTEIDEHTNKQNLNINNSFYDDKSGRLKKMLLTEERKIIEKEQNGRYASEYERKNKTVRRLNLNLQIFKNLRNKSIQKKKNNFHAKNQQVNAAKPQISHRIGNKKTLQPERVYGSLQNLRKQRQRSRNSNYELKSENKNKYLLEQKKTKQKNIILILQQENLVRSSNGKQKRSENENNNDPMPKKNVKKLKRESRLERNQIYRKIFEQKDQSLQKFQIKFEKTNKYDLSREETEIFGDRFPEGFEKLKLLGRGGFSLVWLGEHSKNKKQFAVKQIITQSDHQTHLKQIWFGTLFFQFGGVPKAQFAAHPGIKNLSKLYYYFINKKDTWLMYENCGQSLGNSLYDLKRQRLNGEKLYKIVYKPLYNKIRLNQNQIRKIILETAKALDLLALSNIVHSDLKTENILIRQNTNVQEQSGPQIIKEVKLIDYGSAFVFNNIRQFSMATPQYMAPEVLNFILHENELEFIQKLLEYVENYNNSWVIDVWSLGCVLLEIVSGIPLWMSLKTIVTKPDDNTQVIREGLFAVEGRHFDLIIRKQIQVIQNIDHYLDEQNYSGINLESDLRALLKRMLSLNPKKRVSPSQIIQFLEQSMESESSFIYEQACQKQQI